MSLAIIATTRNPNPAPGYGLLSNKQKIGVERSCDRIRPTSQELTARGWIR